MGWAAVIAGIVGIVSNLVKGAKQAKAASSAGEKAADIIRFETREAVRRATRRNQYVMGQSRARLGASGVSAKSGTAYYWQRETQLEMDRQIKFMKLSGEMRARQAERTGGQMSSMAKLGGISGAFQSFGNMYTGGYQTGSPKPAQGGGALIGAGAGMGAK